MTKVQKNPVLTNTETQIDPYAPLVLLNNERFRSVLLQIISDNLVDYRRFNAIEMYLNTRNPSDTENWNDHPADGLHGLEKAFIFLGIIAKENFDLYSNLDRIAWTIMEGNKSSIHIVAEHILTHWEREIKKYFDYSNLNH